MIKFLRNLNFGYLLLLAGPVVFFVGYQQLSSLGTTEAANDGSMPWLKGAAIAFAGIYLVAAGGLKIYKAKPKRTKRR